jgi:polyisoprenyl-teichoic acid--peptidoglycan teichoic acid transferase
MKFERTILITCASLSILTMGLTWTSPVARALMKEQRIRGIVIGSDYEDNTRHSDTMMVVSYDPQSRFLDVLSIPRDTMISVPQMPSVRRINEIFAHEFKHSGKSFTITSLALKSVVETMLSSGTAQAFSIPYFFTIDYGGFRSLIDSLGGVYVKVTEPMNYDDSWGHLHIHFEPGTYLLDGKRALEYVRYRGRSADQGRVRRQQIFIREMLKRMKSPVFLWRLPSYTRTILSGFHTNLSVWDMAALLLEGRRVAWKNIRLMSLPGTPMGSLWKMNVETTQKIVAMMQAPFAKRGSLELPPSGAGWRGHSTVEVWNASDKPQAAKVVMNRLRQKGFDVVKIGDFSTRQYQTLVVDRSGDLRPAQAVADALKDGAAAEVVSRPEPSLHVDVSVVLGNDFQITDKKWSW